MSELIVRLARPEDMDAVYELTHDAFVGAGLSKPQDSGKLIHFPELDASESTVVIVAEMDGKIIGTNSITFDGPTGIHTDKFFPEETQGIRQEGRKLSSSWRIAVDPAYRHQLKAIRSLIKQTFFEAEKRGIECCLFTFYEKHEKIYQKLIKAKSISRKTYNNEFYSNKLQVLMRVDRESFQQAS